MKTIIDIDIRVGLKMDPYDGHYELTGAARGPVEIDRGTFTWVATAYVETGCDPADGLPTGEIEIVGSGPTELSAIGEMLRKVVAHEMLCQIGEQALD